MDYVALLSQEHPTIPLAELESALEADGIEHEPGENGDGIAFLEGEGVETVVDRLAMTFEISELIHSFEPSNYQKLAAKDVKATKPFAVRKVSVDRTRAPKELESNVGRIINRNSEARVNLDAPEEVFRVYLYDGEAHLCRLLEKVDRGGFESRKNQYRPFSSPVTLHPRMARAMVNLSQVPRDGSLLDPFCGTGGILLEAGLIGCEVYGSDVQEEMVEGTRENLEAFQVEADIRLADFSDVEAVFGRRFDAVVADLPYGKASKVEDFAPEQFVEVATELGRGKAVFMSDRDELGGLQPEFEIFVHRSMSRYLYVVD